MLMITLIFILSLQLITIYFLLGREVEKRDFSFLNKYEETKKLKDIKEVFGVEEEIPETIKLFSNRKR